MSTTIETERLILRPHRLEDFADSAALWSDPLITKHISGKPSSSEEAWARVLRNVGHWTLLDFGYWVIREKQSKRFIGEAGFADLKRDLGSSFDGFPEAGWVIAPWAHGKGFATEAVQGAIAWLESQKGPIRSVCMIAPDNTASMRVATKCGYEDFARATYKEQPAILYERVPF